MPPRNRRAGSTASVAAQNAFGAPERSYRAANSSSLNTSSASLGILNTSVNVATAFANAQSSTSHPSVTARRGFSRSPQPPAPLSLPPVGRQRMISPAAEMLAHSAQATQPVSYFLTADEDDAISGGRRSIMSPPTGSEASEEDDSYGAEEAFVRQQQQNAAAGPSRAAAARRGRNNRYDGDAWRPARTDSDGDSGAGDEPAAVTPRETRHRDARKRKDASASGYLGGPRIRKETTVKASETPTPTMISMTRGDGNHTPLATVIPEEPGSPTPSHRREPTTTRVFATNVTQGVAGLLLVDNWYETFARPLRDFNKWRVRHRDRLPTGLTIAGIAMVVSLLYIFRNVSPKSQPYLAPTKLPSSMEDLAERVVNMEGHLQGLTKKVNLENQDTAANYRDMRDLVSKIKVDVNNLAARQDGHSSAIKSLEGDMSSLKARIGSLERDIRSALDDGRLQSALVRILPRHLPVRYEKGNMAVDPHFYAELKKLFVGQGEIESTIRKMIDGGVQTPKDQWSVNKYERELEAWADKLFERWTSDSKYIERSEFVDLVHKELSEVMKDVKVSPGLINRAPITIKTSKGEDITAPLQALVDAALLKYSKDQLALPDYALLTAGGRAVPVLTSPTLVLRPASSWSFWLAGKQKEEGRMPATALYPDSTVGNCWPFAGDKGTLGILLARRVQVTSVTVEHAAHEVTFDQRSAPKTIEVWGSVDGAENLAKAQAYLDKRERMDGASDATLSQAETPEKLLLASFTYDATSATPIQTFPVPADLVEAGIDMGIVVFSVQSNWGGDFTCLYRVRVHGKEIPMGVGQAREQDEDVNVVDE